MITHDQVRRWLVETGQPSHIVVGDGHAVHLISCGIDHADSGKAMFSYAPDASACIVANLSCRCGRIRRMPVLRPVGDAASLFNELLAATSADFMRPAAPSAPVPPLRPADTRTRASHRPAPPAPRTRPSPPAPVTAARSTPLPTRPAPIAPRPAPKPAPAPVQPARPAPPAPRPAPPAPLTASKPFDVSDHRHTKVRTFAAQRAADPRAAPRGVCPHCGGMELLRTNNTMMRHKLGLKLCPGVYQPTANLVQE